MRPGLQTKTPKRCQHEKQVTETLVTLPSEREKENPKTNPWDIMPWSLKSEVRHWSPEPTSVTAEHHGNLGGGDRRVTQRLRGQLAGAGIQQEQNIIPQR